jgi:predicted phage terminase large subunit-like protein
MHSKVSLINRRNLDPIRFDCLYQGNPESKEGLLYQGFKTYEELPPRPRKIACYIDTADAGEDYLCAVCYQLGADHQIYVTDILYTQAPMEITEGLASQMLKRNSTRETYIESNSGGRSFARVVQRLTPSTNVRWFHQGANKESRILTNAALVTQNIYFPEGWESRFSDFHNHIRLYKRHFSSNRFHDAPDVLTGIIEKHIAVSSSRGPRRRN